MRRTPRTRRPTNPEPPTLGLRTGAEQRYTGPHPIRRRGPSRFRPDCASMAGSPRIGPTIRGQGRHANSSHASASRAFPRPSPCRPPRRNTTRRAASITKSVPPMTSARAFPSGASGRFRPARSASTATRSSRASAAPSPIPVRCPARALSAPAASATCRSPRSANPRRRSAAWCPDAPDDWGGRPATRTGSKRGLTRAFRMAPRSLHRRHVLSRRMHRRITGARPDRETRLAFRWRRPGRRASTPPGVMPGSSRAVIP